MYFNNVIQYCRLSIRECPRPLNRGVRWIGVRYKGKYKTLILGPGLGSVPGVRLKEGVRLIGGPLNKGFTAFTTRESNLGYPVCE